MGHELSGVRAGAAVRRVLAGLLAVLLSGCVAPPGRIAMPGTIGRNTAVAPLRVQLREGTQLVVREVPLELYAAGAALSEVHPPAGDAALAARVYEVQTVIARSYAVTNRGRHAAAGFDLCSTTHCQLYEPERFAASRWSAVARAAAQHTAGQVLWFAGAPARAIFHADCGGHTSDAAAVWGGVAPGYLAGRPDGVPPASAHTGWTFETALEPLRAALNADARTAVGARLDRIEVAGRDTAGRAEQIVLRGTRTFVVRGEIFRDVVTRRLGARTLRSTLFTVTRSKTGLVFTGRGFGHGVGLCQAGALARLRAGESPRQVLAFYFPGTTSSH